MNLGRLILVMMDELSDFSASPKQIGLMNGMIAEVLNSKDRQLRLDFISHLVGYQVRSSNELSKSWVEAFLELCVETKYSSRPTELLRSYAQNWRQDG
jgi:hypothetical protein